MRIVMFPLFLFSGTFFPVSRLPDWLRAGVVAVAAVARGRAVPGGDDGLVAVGRDGARPRRVPGRVPRRRVLVGRAPVHPGVDVVITRDRGQGSGPAPEQHARVRWRVVERNTARVPAHVAGLPHRPVRAAALPAVDRDRRGWAGRQGAGPGRTADPVRPVRRARVDGGGGDERRGARHHVQLLLQVQVRAHLRRDARDAARGRRRRASAS